MAKCLIVILLVAVLLGLGQQKFPMTAVAQGPTPESTDEQPSVVKVGLYIINVGKLDTATGAYTVDFYLSFSCDQPCQPGEFEFANGRATSIDKTVDEPTEKFYRIQAALVSNLNLSKYPFDEHHLLIQIEDKTQTSKTQIYQVSDPDTGVDPAVNIVGWDLKEWTAKVFDHHYAIYGTDFSAYQFDIHIGRPPTAALLKSFLPALTIIAVGLLALLLSPDKIIPRLTLTTGSLTGAVLFHLNLTSSIPPIGYLTFADRFMIVNYFALALTLISTLVALRYVDQKKPEAAERIHRTAMVTLPALWVGVQVINFLVR
jgi:hypothetical protein